MFGLELGRQYHPVRRWPAAEQSEPAVLCGVCRTEMSVDTYVGTAKYLQCSRPPFNPGCRPHHGYYFEPPSGHQVR
jgi:uncharacterized CHY-type Zn-finger protein